MHPTSFEKSSLKLVETQWETVRTKGIVFAILLLVFFSLYFLDNTSINAVDFVEELNQPKLNKSMAKFLQEREVIYAKRKEHIAKICQKHEIGKQNDDVTGTKIIK